MVIRKLFKFEGAHIVRNCSSKRCSRSQHGHSYTVEVFLTSNKLDNGGMVVDFGLLKGPISDLIDSFDHALSIWNKEDPGYIGYLCSWSERWIKMPVSPSAENYALMFLYIIDKIIKNTQFNNGEGNVKVSSVRVHETATGYAEADFGCLNKVWVKFGLNDIEFSPGIQEEWKDKEWYNKLKTGEKFINPIVPVQIKVNEA